MNIAVLSGKGGTGKTLVSVNLASVIENSTYIDCDVEEANGHLFFKAENIKEVDVSVKIPLINTNKCLKCRECVQFCKFNALAFINDKVMVFEDVCHSCGGCSIVCKSGAIDEKDKNVGSILSGKSESINTATGILNIGEASGVPIIKELLTYTKDYINIIDCPPGSACIVMESIREADYCILVAEQSLFGKHNLEMVHELVNIFDKKHGVVLNKCVANENPSKLYCLENNIKILGEIDFDHKLGLLNSNSEIVSRKDDSYYKKFSDIFNNVLEEIKI